MSEKRSALISESPTPNKSGRRTVLMLLTNAYDPDPRVREEALALIAMGCRVRLIAWDRDLKAPRSEVLEGVEIDRVFLRSSHGRGSTQLFFYAVLYLRMLWMALNTSFEVVHCHDLDTLPLGFVAGKLKRRPIVYDAHESFSDMLSGNIHSLLRHSLVRLENFMIRRINLLITVGEKLRRHLAERGARNSVVVGNWKRLEDYSRTAEENANVRSRLAIPADALLAVCITQLLKDRKITELLEAIDETPDVYLIIGGVGVLKELVEHRAANNPRIRYVGFVRPAEIPIYTCAGDVVYYGFDPENPNARYSAPNKLFEALAAGRPLITGDFGEIADVVRRASCGVILPEYSVDEIKSAFAILRDTMLRESAGSNARRFGSELMNWRRAEWTLYQAYSALLPAGCLKWSGSWQNNFEKVVRNDVDAAMEAVRTA